MTAASAATRLAGRAAVAGPPAVATVPIEPRGAVPSVVEVAGAPTAAVPEAPIAAVAVVVPVRNEERLLPACLASVAVAMRTLRQERGLAGQLTVVLDRCTDASARIVRDAGVDAIVSGYGRVGAARALGAEHALSATARTGVPLTATWLACTDADGAVPEGWLARMVLLADAGADCVVGTVEPTGLSPQRAREWARLHDLRDGHPHVHGANLGVRGSTYRLAGGFPDAALHEDRLLVETARRRGARVVATDSTRVLTSGRLRSRLAGGFAEYLHALSPVSRPGHRRA